MIHSERLICRWCPYSFTRFVDGGYTPVNPYLLMRSHIQSEHPAEYQRIEHYLSEEVIVRGKE